MTDTSTRLSAESLRWRCPPEWIGVDSTEDVEPVSGIVGQDDAVDALRFGLSTDALGQNVYVRGYPGTGRLTLVRMMLEQARPDWAPAPDHVYVHDFERSDRPRRITLKRGRGRPFALAVDDLVTFLRTDLDAAMSSNAMRERQEELEGQASAQLDVLREPFEAELHEANLTMSMVQMGNVTQPALMPVHDGQPLMPERYAQLREEGVIDDEAAKRIEEDLARFAARFAELGRAVQQVQEVHRKAVRHLIESELRTMIGSACDVLLEDFPNDGVRAFLAALVDDLVRLKLQSQEFDEAFWDRYRVNPVAVHDEDDPPHPVVRENAPTLKHLLGSIEGELVGQRGARADHTMVRSGALLAADGGWLILDARDLVSEPGSWKCLVRTLRSGELQIVPPELALPWTGAALMPEPIPVRVKVVLLGDPQLYAMLDGMDPDFPELFKLLADLETTLARNERGAKYYVGVVARLLRNEGLRPFARDALATLVEHGARIAAQPERLTTRFGRLADIVREAVFVAREHGEAPVSGADVVEAVRRGKRRADLPARRYRERIGDGTIRVETKGHVVGQVNGLAVIGAGNLSYGFPARITTSIGPGTAGTINIEGEAALSGSIHTKGFYILGGLLRHLLRTKHPLAFSASIAFEQSYGGIDGDSASGAEMCCLLSALTDIPLDQGLAMTGAIDQKGHIQPIGAVTEKVEGFFEACRDQGLTGSQGVIVPRANVDELMLHSEVVEACRAGVFSVNGVDTIHEALHLFTGWEVGLPDDDGRYQAGTLLRLAQDRAREYWRLAAARPLEAGE